MLSEDQLLFIINQLFDAGKKCEGKEEFNSVNRHIKRIQNLMEEQYTIYSPAGEKYDETRTDCEATIMEGADRELFVREVLKPCIANKSTGVIIQKAVVLAG